MNLADELDALRAASAEKIPEDQRVIMDAAEKELKASGILSWVPKVGDFLSDFTLKNAFGMDVHAADLLSQGPLVLSAFRGAW